MLAGVTGRSGGWAPADPVQRYDEEQPGHGQDAEGGNQEETTQHCRHACGV
jgi:hypothetical protein